MPILFMALIALAVFLVMGLMLFFAAYEEARTPHGVEPLIPDFEPRSWYNLRVPERLSRFCARRH
jgi:hypothetical protein